MSFSESGALLKLQGFRSTRYFIQATTNFADWLNILTYVATGNLMHLMDVDVSNYACRFYRWRHDQ